VHVVDAAAGVRVVLLAILRAEGLDCSGGAPPTGHAAPARADVLVVGPLCAPAPVLRAAAGAIPVVVVTPLPEDEREGDWSAAAAVVRTGRVAEELATAVRRALAGYC
jgi:hypothetical protein